MRRSKNSMKKKGGGGELCLERGKPYLSVGGEVAVAARALNHRPGRPKKGGEAERAAEAGNETLN